MKVAKDVIRLQFIKKRRQAGPIVQQFADDVMQFEDHDSESSNQIRIHHRDNFILCSFDVHLKQEVTDRWAAPVHPIRH